MPSPLTSAAPARAPPRKFGSSMPRKAAMQSAGLAVEHLTRGPPPSSGERM